MQRPLRHPINAPTASSKPAPPTVVVQGSDLESWCRRWKKQPALGIDTEFFRERTFYPDLGLIQVNDGTNNVLIDPIAIENLDAFQDVLQDANILKVFHSCGEDLEVLFYRFGLMPQPFFDNQVAAAFVGLGYSIGYRNLVEKLCGVDLPKGETRSNWLRRPLSQAQLNYAALDVAYLLPTYRFLVDQLQSLGRMDWVQQELRPLTATERFSPDPDTLYLKMASPAMSQKDLAVLRSLTAWRERRARKRNLPRNFVIRKPALIELARKRPRTGQQLDRLSQLRPAEIRRYGKEVLRLIDAAMHLPTEQLPPPIRRPLDLTPHRKLVQKLRKAVTERADDLEMPVELIANRKTLESLVRRRMAGRVPLLPDFLHSWKKELLAEIWRDLE